jgi:glycosyltransferase involved in cell wall biosynthesis
MSQLPAISVIIPAFNVEPFIAETIESLLAQTFRDFEAIVVNDGSTDGTEARLAPYLDRIVYLKQENKGVMAARNAGIRASRGRMIALLDGDDLWMPDFLETLSGMMESDVGLSVAFPNAEFFGSPNFAGRLHQDVFPVAEPVTFDRVLRRECYIFGSLVIRREAIEDAGMFDETLEGQGAEDFDLWLRMLERGHRFKFTGKPLVRYRWRRDSLSNDGVNLLSCVVSVYEKFLARNTTTVGQREWIASQLPEMRARLSLARFKEALAAMDFKRAAEHLESANGHCRRPKIVIAQIAMRLASAVMRNRMAPDAGLKIGSKK